MLYKVHKIHVVKQEFTTGTVEGDIVDILCYNKCSVVLYKDHIIYTVILTNRNTLQEL